MYGFDVKVMKPIRNQYFHKQVKVVKGRKVPIGTTGECFWMGAKCYSKYGDPWGIYTQVRIGIKDEAGNVFWTSLDNVEVLEAQEDGEEA